MSEKNNTIAQLEAMLFAAGDPVEPEKLADTRFPFTPVTYPVTLSILILLFYDRLATCCRMLSIRPSKARLPVSYRKPRCRSSSRSFMA